MDHLTIKRGKSIKVIFPSLVLPANQSFESVFSSSQPEKSMNMKEEKHFLRSRQTLNFRLSIEFLKS